ncbi:MAG: glycosyltransferase family 39 protein [Anaerolineae bacterium]|nr:glycosyltransferase family 39 protein [Anaerolineae bacterium]
MIWGLWLWQLEASDLTFDEAATYYIAHRSPREIIAYLRRAVREHPPLYYLLINRWMALTGISEFSLRLFSVCIGLIALVLTGWVVRLIPCRRLRDIGLISAATLALIPGAAYYVREARMYSLMLLWVVISSGLSLRDWLNQDGWPAWRSVASLLIVDLLAMTTHYYALLSIAALPAALLLLRRWRPLAVWLISHGLIVLAGIAWLLSAPGLQMTTAGMLAGLDFQLPSYGQIQYLLGKLLFSPVVGFDVTLLMVVLVAAGAGLVLCLWRCRSLGVYLLFGIALPPALAFVLPHPPAPRYVLGLLPHLAMVLSTACLSAVHLSRHKWSGTIISISATAGVLLTLVAGGLHDALALERSRYGRTIQFVQASARTNDAVLFYGPWQRIQYYYYAPDEFPPIVMLPEKSPPRLDPARAEPVLENLLSMYDRVWVLPASVSDVDPEHFAEGWLSEHAHRVLNTQDFQLYLRQLPSDAPARELNVIFGPCLNLDRVAYESDRVAAGEGLRVALAWRTQCHVNDFELTLTLSDSRGHIWVEENPAVGEWWAVPSQWTLGEAMVDNQGLFVPQGAPAGEYVVRLSVADAETGESLMMADGKAVDLFTFQVDEPEYAPVLSDTSTNWTFCPPAEGQCLTLVNYRPGGRNFQQGYAIPFELQLLVPYSLQRDVQLRLRVEPRTWMPGTDRNPITERMLTLPDYTAAASMSGAEDENHLFLPIVSSSEAAVTSTMSSSPQRLLTLPDALSLPADARTGPARITLEILGPNGESWLTTNGRSTLRLFNVRIDGRPVSRRMPSNLTHLSVTFDDGIELRGYRIDGVALPGEELRISYAWYAEKKPQAIYAVFNHLVGAGGQVVTQVDGWPQEGRMLTTQWETGEYVEDHHTLEIPSDAPPGPYSLYVGLYNAATADRLPAYQDGKRLAGDHVTIEVGD